MSDTDSSELETTTGSCPCCGYHGELTYVDEDIPAAPKPKRRTKRRRIAAQAPEHVEQTGIQDLFDQLEPVVAKPAVEQNDGRSYIQGFFDKYPDFAYDPSAPTMHEFYRMCEQFEETPPDAWSKPQARNEIKDALTQQFNDIYGTNENDLSAWQNLCRVLNLLETPDDLFRCRQIVKSTFVNIVDLIDTKMTEEPVRHFKTEELLSEYTRLTGKNFPKDNAYAGGFLKFLLRDIIHPGSHRSRTHDDSCPARERSRRGL